MLYGIKAYVIIDRGIMKVLIPQNNVITVILSVNDDHTMSLFIISK